jgi:signal transduction histidine kinase
MDDRASRRDRRVLQREVFVGAVAAIALAWVLALASALWLATRAERIDAREHARAAAEALAQLAVPPDGGETVLAVGLVDSYAWVEDAEGNVVAESAAVRELGPANLPAAPPGGTRTAIVAGSTLSDRLDGDHAIAVHRDAATGRTAWVIAPATGERGERFVAGRMMVALTVLASAAIAAQILVLRRSLHPVVDMSEELDEIEAHDLTRRVAVGERADSISRLGRTINRLLDRLDRARLQQERFAAAASHELRSPISAIRSELEVGLTYPDRVDWRELATESLVEVERLEELSRDLRSLTRPTIARPPAQLVRIDDLIRSKLERRPPPPGIEYALDLAPVSIEVNPDEFIALLRNLFSNAERHALSSIGVQLVEERDGVELHVINDGASIPPEQQDWIFEPFHRLDEARAYDDGGSGLGLAIARSIAETYGGSLRSVPRNQGAEFVARFPQPRP